MAKRLLYILFFGLLSLSYSTTASANIFAEIELTDNNVALKTDVSFDDNILRVTEGSGLTLRIYNIAGGAPVLTLKVDSQDKRVEINLPKGIYIVKVGKVARKIVVK